MASVGTAGSNASTGNDADRQGVSHKILRNSASNILRGAISLPIALILTPLLVKGLGIHAFGIWSLIFVFVQSATLLDLGLSSSLIKFVAEYNEQRNYSRLNRTLNSALAVYGLIGFVVVAGLWLSRDAILSGLFKANPHDSHLNAVLGLALGVFFVQLMTSVFSSLLQGLQRIDLANVTLLLVQIVHFGLALWVLWLGHGLLALVAVQGAAVCAGWLASMVLVARVYPQLRWSVQELDWTAIRRLLPLGFSMQCLSLHTLIFYQFDKIVLSTFFGPAYAGYYDVAARPLTSLRNVPLAVVQPVMPAVAELQARQEKGPIQEVFLNVCKYTVLSSAPVFLAIALLARPLLDLWFGTHPPQGLELVAWNLRLLALTYFVNLVGAAVTYVAVGLGQQRVLFRYAVLASALQVILTLLGIRLVGYLGAPLGILAGTTIAVSYYFWEFRRSTALTARPLLRMAWKPIVLATGLGLVAAAVLQAAPRSWPILTAAIVAAYFTAYGIGIWAMRCVTREEIDPVWEFLKHSGSHLSLWMRNRLHRLGRFAFRLATTPEERLKHVLLRRFGGGEQSDKLDLRWAVMWGWGLDRIRRNVAVAQRVRELQNGTRLRVLDVGASDCGVRAFLPSQDFDVFSLDLNWENISTNGNKGRAVHADGCLLPFADGAFDVVVSVDSLEHVPPQHRLRYLNELGRVARHRVVLHFPAVGSGHFQGSRFDALFQRRYGLLLRRDKNIEEHLQNGLPNIQEIAARFPGCTVLGRENGPLWLKYMLLERIPYVSFLSGLAFLGSRSRLDSPPFHAALLTYDLDRPGEELEVRPNAGD